MAKVKAIGVAGLLNFYALLFLFSVAFMNGNGKEKIAFYAEKKHHRKQYLFSSIPYFAF